jgi:cation diffusion facilitator family transporter
MHTTSVAKWQHSHIFGQDQVRSSENRTLAVIIITAIMMVVEIVVGAVFGSMALLADGIHMGSHMVGLLISLIAYIYARKYAHDRRFSFGTGKVNSLAGYSSALFLVLFAAVMGYESIMRLFNPVSIQYNIAITVAIIGLVVNGVSMLILGEKGHTHDHGGGHDHGAHDHAHDQAHDHAHEHGAHDHMNVYVHDHGDHDHANDYTHEHGDHHDHGHAGESGDHNLKAAYLHVLTDALTSVFAIFALLCAKYIGLVWMDPLMGIVGAIMVIRWSFSLLGSASKVLLDHQIPADIQKSITGIIESYKDTRVCDLHLWSIGPGIFATAFSVVTKYPESPEKYKSLIPPTSGVVHATVEVHYCPD